MGRACLNIRSLCAKPVSIVIQTTPDKSVRSTHLVAESRAAGIEHVVISLSDMDTMAERFRAAGAEVRLLGMRPGAPNPLPLLRLTKWIVEARPDIVQTWMYHADIFGRCRRVAGSPGVPASRASSPACARMGCPSNGSAHRQGRGPAQVAGTPLRLGVQPDARFGDLLRQRGIQDTRGLRL